MPTLAPLFVAQLGLPVAEYAIVTGILALGACGTLLAVATWLRSGRRPARVPSDTTPRD